MSRITTALFDFDGVVADTEPLYNLFWEKTARRYRIADPDFVSRIKGTNLETIFRNYFQDFPEEVRQEVARDSARYELEMEFREVPGACAFLRRLKGRGMKLAVVTSSNKGKLELALHLMGLEGIFDTSLAGDEISRGKPDPYCYLLAASRLGARPGECVVFEDSFPGIAAGKAAGMPVVGLSTTNPAESLKGLVDAVIPDFTRPEEVMRILDGKAG